MPETDPRKQELKMQIEAGVLTISIGVEALAIAVEGGPNIEENAKVTDADVFAAELLVELQAEDEIGSNIIYRAFDTATEAATEGGAQGIAFPDDEDDD